VNVFLFLSTAGSEKEGERIARSLVKEGLAACVNLVPRIQSFFFWEGRLRKEREVLILGKTTRGKLDLIKIKIKDLHSYSVPEILFIEVAGGEEKYLEWVQKMTAKRPKKNIDIKSIKR
jgi:periplasmic divalent cation tolerance protein